MFIQARSSYSQALKAPKASSGTELGASGLTALCVIELRPRRTVRYWGTTTSLAVTVLNQHFGHSWGCIRSLLATFGHGLSGFGHGDVWARIGSQDVGYSESPPILCRPRPSRIRIAARFDGSNAVQFLQLSHRPFPPPYSCRRCCTPWTSPVAMGFLPTFLSLVPKKVFTVELAKH